MESYMAKEMSIAQLNRELERRMKELDRLKRKRDKLVDQLEDVDRQITEIEGGGAAGGTATGKSATQAGKKGKKSKKAAGGLKKSTGAGRRLPKNAKPLPAYIQDVLAGGPMRAKDIAKKVQEIGYKTNAKDFYGIVAQALRDPDLFERQGRGVYRLKKKD
jgi:chromosome segregation ATPase